MSGELKIGDNPLPPLLSFSLSPHSTTFYHRYCARNSVMTTFFPLRLSGRPLFYYIHFPDKKGRLSVERGEVNVVNVRRPLLPLQRVSKTDYRSEPIYYLDPNVVDNLCPFVTKTTNSGEMWETNGLT